MIDFSTLQGLTIPEGVVSQITDASGRVLWAVSGGKVILEVEKITSDTYAAETTYTGEQFVLIQVYPKTNGTVKVTYGGLTKTITDTSGAAEPRPQQVFFGTFNGVSDGVTTPASGTLTIEGDYTTFCEGSFNSAKASIGEYTGITSIKSFGSSTHIVGGAFHRCEKLASVTISDGITRIEAIAFGACTGLVSVTFKNTSGWYVTETKGGDASTGLGVDVTDAANNAKMLVDTYCDYYWYRA